LLVGVFDAEITCEEACRVLGCGADAGAQKPFPLTVQPGNRDRGDD